MIKILMDECLPKKLKYRIEELEPDFFVKTTPDTEYREALWDLLPLVKKLPSIMRAHEPGKFLEIQ
jgi:hypothetical protein